jgi:hypothetical protein
MHDESAPAASTDPLKAVADALDAAVQATKEGAEKARATAADALPAASQFLSTAVYKTCYSISFGIVFPTVLLARSLPKNNAAVHGFIDGAQAAIDMIHDMKSKSASSGPV